MSEMSEAGEITDVVKEVGVAMVESCGENKFHNYEINIIISAEKFSILLAEPGILLVRRRGRTLYLLISCARKCCLEKLLHQML